MEDQQGVSFNGMIYNYLEIKKILQKKKYFLNKIRYRGIIKIIEYFWNFRPEIFGGNVVFFYYNKKITR